MKNCIICDKENDSKSVEHIVPESLGNKNYTIEKGLICDECNHRFSKFEMKALGNSIFAFERARLGIISKKGKTAKGKIGEIEVEGDKDFKKGFITVKGLNNLNFTEYDPKTNIGHLIVAPYDKKSEVATSKLLLKMGIESLFASQNKVFKNNDFTDLKNYLRTITNNVWPIITTDINLNGFKDIPRYYEKYVLGKETITLKYLQIDEKTLLFQFSIGGIKMQINLPSRKTSI